MNNKIGKMQFVQLSHYVVITLLHVREFVSFNVLLINMVNELLSS